MIFNRLLGLFSHDLAIDLGTATTLVYVKGRGSSAPSPRRWRSTGHPGNEEGARRRDRGEADDRPHAGEHRGDPPIKDGVIADFEVTEAMLRYFHPEGPQGRTLVRPRIIICVPYGCTEWSGAPSASPRRARAPGGVSHRGAAGGRDRAGPPHHRTVRQHDRRHRGGTTEWRSSPSGDRQERVGAGAGDKMDEAILQYVKRKYNLQIGEPTAEHIKVAIGNAFPGFTETTEIKGLDMVSGVPKAMTLHSDEVREALSEPVRIIVDAVKSVFEETPPELAGDIYDRGIVLAGGGALLRNLDALLREETGLPVTVAEDPLSCVVLGSARRWTSSTLLRQVALH